jgi:hypothetical protein
MDFDPLRRMLDRARRHGEDSDATLFSELLLVGEFIVKVTAAAFVAGIDEDREHHRYALLHALVRAGGVGDWAAKLDEVLTGPAGTHLAASMHEIRNLHSERCGEGDWRYEAVTRLHEVLVGVHPDAQALPGKRALRLWFTTFAELRNKTRGHGATTPATASKLVETFRQSIQLVADNSPVFQLSWAYLYRNLSGRYRVTMLGGKAEPFERLKTAAASGEKNIPNGVYLYAGTPREVQLIHSDPDASDYLVPNGNFNGATYELLSLSSDERRRGDASPYLAPAGDRPPSETEGAADLEVIGQAFANLPEAPSTYVERLHLEAEISKAIVNDRHPIVTLVGRGGIGKTSLALTILHKVVESDRFGAVIWFSARDIDLTTSGAKLVRPKVLTERDIAREYKRLIGNQPGEADEKSDPIDLMARHLRSGPFSPTLFVFDNFETVRSPVDLFNWLDLNIRLPNKVLITSRFRDFKADFPIEVSGMEDDEAGKLIDATAQRFGISHLIGDSQRRELVEELDGHPYVIKIALGEMANEGKYSKPDRIVARKEDILEALFERTFAALSPTAGRIFLTLSLWRSLVPQLAVEAVLLRHKGEQANPTEAIEQLVRSSLVERSTADDGTDFLEVPLTAALFGRRKAEVSPIKQIIDADLTFLRDIGATSATGLRHGIAPKVEAFFNRTARRIEAGEVQLADMREVLEFFANSFPPAWLYLARMDEERSEDDSIAKATESVRRFLETDPEPVAAQAAWLHLTRLYRIQDDAVGACSAFLRSSKFGEPSIVDVSQIANMVNNSDEVKSLDRDERAAFYGPLATMMEDSLEELSPTELSRLAWMYLHMGDEDRAWELAQNGLEIDPTNIHCRRLSAKLSN